MTATISVYKAEALDSSAETQHEHDNCVNNDTNLITVLKPAKSVYASSNKSFSEVSIRRTLAGDLYLALTDVDNASKLINLRVLVKPLINWVWIGGIVMVLGASLILVVFYTKKLSRIQD
jgi:cytochrome c-type biogenesis protein CcmF